MAGSAQQGPGMITGINVTPLVDITLVLLIIFMVTARIVVSPTVPLDLPVASHTDAQQTVFSVIIPKNGPTMVNGQTVPDDASLVNQARAALAADSALRAVVNADGDVPHRKMVHMLDLLRRAGVNAIAFGATPLE
ncbi:MAG: biopolymer transporter ExbD [Clostridia bacterium]|nr:biopolymer transporter ExbD [Deltaproteobacteria bacterium]